MKYEMGGTYNTHEIQEKYTQSSGQKLENKRPSARCRWRWENIIKINLKNKVGGNRLN